MRFIEKIEKIISTLTQPSLESIHRTLHNAVIGLINDSYNQLFVNLFLEAMAEKEHKENQYLMNSLGYKQLLGVFSQDSDWIAFNTGLHKLLKMGGFNTRSGTLIVDHHGELLTNRWLYQIYDTQHKESLDKMAFEPSHDLSYRISYIHRTYQIALGKILDIQQRRDFSAADIPSASPSSSSSLFPPSSSPQSILLTTSPSLFVILDRSVTGTDDSDVLKIQERQEEIIAQLRALKTLTILDLANDKQMISTHNIIGPNRSLIGALAQTINEIYDEWMKEKFPFLGKSSDTKESRELLKMLRHDANVVSASSSTIMSSSEIHTGFTRTNTVLPRLDFCALFLKEEGTADIAPGAGGSLQDVDNLICYILIKLYTFRTGRETLTKVLGDFQTDLPDIVAKAPALIIMSPDVINLVKNDSSDPNGFEAQLYHLVTPYVESINTLVNLLDELIRQSGASGYIEALTQCSVALKSCDIQLRSIVGFPNSPATPRSFKSPRTPTTTPREGLTPREPSTLRGEGDSTTTPRRMGFYVTCPLPPKDDAAKQKATSLSTGESTKQNGIMTSDPVGVERPSIF